MQRHWLMKSEPDEFSIYDLARAQRSLWEGVRNYQARNFMLKDMAPGDFILFYHSNHNPPGVAGLARVSAPAVADPSQFDKKSSYFDPKATPTQPIWFCVEVEYVKTFPHLLSLSTIRDHPRLQDLLLLKKGQRLSVQPLTANQFKLLTHLAETL